MFNWIIVIFMAITLIVDIVVVTKLGIGLYRNTGIDTRFINVVTAVGYLIIVMLICMLYRYVELWNSYW